MGFNDGPKNKKLKDPWLHDDQLRTALAYYILKELGMPHGNNYLRDTKNNPEKLAQLIKDQYFDRVGRRRITRMYQALTAQK